MDTELWRLGALELAARIRAGDCSARQATEQTLARIADVNPAVNALAEVMADEALSAADAADRALAAGLAPGPLHGVPVTVKVNVDTAGHATTDGIVAQRGNVATSDSPLVAHLRAAGAVIVGRSNTPAFSLRWFTDNDLHGRTLNPFDAGVTPGGSSGGAAAAVATGMGAIAHGNDYGGSIRHPAYACGVVGLRTTVGRVPAYKASAPTRLPSNQMMSVQGPLTRNVADARLALQVMAQGRALDPQWTPAPLSYADSAEPLRVALFLRHPAYDADPAVTAALRQAARALEVAGCVVEEAEPPHFEEGATLWRQLVMDDLRRGGQAAIQTHGDAAVQSALAGYLHGLPALDRDATLAALARRHDIARDWALFLQRWPLLLMPVSWQRPFPVDADVGAPEQVLPLLRAQSPLLGTAMLGLPGLSVPTGLDAGGVPTGVQLVADRFREDRLLRGGEIIEAAARFSALDHLAPR
ncbi:amidase [Rubrivivax albus]|uniref:Amidase n=1 Tax=Rubrivivax albus TaxID=2499835 RepID=A0A437JW13_9BURK|nr:amidase [Rubrivivax albus]RVT51567.1 amidase [Rubrivivax albus]